MAARQTFLGYLFAVLGLAVALLPAASVRGQQIGEANRLWALIVADSFGEKVGSGCDEDGNNMAQLLRSAFQNRPQRLSLTVMNREQATPDNVRRYYQAVQPGQGDALFFFYSGHGGMNRQTQEHFLTMNAGALSRVELRQMMEGRGAQLNVLITNCCSSYPPEGELIAAQGAPELAPFTPPDWRVFDDLLLRHRGTVDITAALPGTPGWVDLNEGGFFTGAVIHKLHAPLNWIDRDGDGFASWTEFFSQVREETNATFVNIRNNTPADAEIRGYNSQWPYAFNLPGVGGGEAIARPQPIVQFRKYLRFQNMRNEQCRFYVKYQTLNENNEWEWFPRGGGWLSYDVPPGAEFFPYHGTQAINAHSVIFAADALQTGGNAPPRQHQLVGPEGYQSATMQPIKIRVW